MHPFGRSNVLIITASNHRADCFGFMGRRIKTPHLDRLAGGGTHFSACLSPSHVGQPARASMLTGLLPLSHGVVDNGIDMPADLVTRGFAHQLSRSGYFTALIGKAHFSTRNTYARTGTPECRFSGADYPDSWRGPYAGFDYVELIQGHMTRLRPPLRPPQGLHYERWFFSRGNNDEAFRLWQTALPPLTSAAQTWHSGLPVAWHSSSWVGDRAADLLSTAAAMDRPFCIWISFSDPHFPYDCPEPWSRLHDPSGVDIPEHRKLSFEGRPWWHRASIENVPQIADPLLRRSRSEGARITSQSDAELADMTANYYGMISLIDHNVGRVLERMDQLGLSKNTMIMYTSDSSDLLGDHGWHLKAPVAYEGMLRMPMIIKGRGIPESLRCEDPVSTADIAPTVLEWCGASPSPGVQGKSLLSLFSPNAPGRQVSYSEWNLHPSRCGVALRLRTVRTRRHKLMIDLDSEDGEMYDLCDDPCELVNLYGNPGKSGIRNRLLQLLHERPGDTPEEYPAPVGIA